MIANLSEGDVNDPMSMNFIRFMSAKSESDMARVYAHNHHGIFTEMYKNFAEAEIFDPRMELKKAKHAIEAYLKRRAKAAWVNATRTFNLTPNANFYGIATSSISSAVHIPTPVYERNAEVLLKIDWSDIDQLYRANREQTRDLAFQMFCSESGFMRYFPDAEVLLKIDWSDIDQLYRANREQTRDLAFQMFCSESGFMRYFPAASWIWDNKEDQLDLYDCRSTEWFINGATLSKNVVIMLDLSGSMLGQRFEIAKQTVEAILETLSDNDFFNILPFSKAAAFLDECAEQAELLQATMRNKKLLRARLNSMSSEGKAEYEKGLAKAFETLLKLPGTVNITTADELAAKREKGQLPEDLHVVTSEDHILVMPRQLYQAMRNYTNKREQLGCNDVIMLITDGAPSYFKEIFQLYNERKTVRFFSFLIGEEAIDFEQVKWMACSNKGFMVHISNLADVQEKVQYYIKVMSRPLGKHASAFQEEDAIWSGVYRERLLGNIFRPFNETQMVQKKNVSPVRI
ncbi:Voltage-dependent calcium channel unc-36 [Toxocara canis]|uniref:Voltage-dependent calcium channel unc-36 n=1 Tax=Toxocara canis TaxID=6265 RepID=A0A0B2VXG9_TOXCA|nr:Voltage-dependent calcium channel unc-36 [Toxocara canis]